MKPEQGPGAPASEPAEHRPYVPPEASLPELTWKALAAGLVMAVVLGAANAYLGLRAGQTVSATFPAAVLAIALFRLPFFRGNVLEQNIARTTASVGEALAAGAIFTLPAFVLATLGGERLWTRFNYWESSAILLVGGVLGVLMVILLRRTLVVDASLPFPESYACYEIVRAGQKGESGARYVFGAMGVGALIQLLKSPGGIQVFSESVSGFLRFPQSVIRHFTSSREPLGAIEHTGGVAFSSPAASPALLGVGYIIGPRLATINFCGGALAWLVLIPLGLFLNPGLGASLATEGRPPEWPELAFSVWYNQVRPLAVGAMLVSSIYTLWGLRGSVGSAFARVFRKAETAAPESRLDRDLEPRWILLGTVVLVLPMSGLFYYFTGSLAASLLAAVLMTVVAFLFTGVGGWLVGLVGGSNQPISGLALSALILAALLMLALGVTGLPGVAAVLAVAAVVCCATAMAGDMIQDLKVGHLLGGTPWKMELAELIAAVVVAFVLVGPIVVLHDGSIAQGGLGIGGPDLPAPQAGLMAQLATGIVGGELPWGLIVIGMLFAVVLILLKAPAPMLIAVGMYLPFETSFAIFAGGLLRGIGDRLAARRAASAEQRMRQEGVGTLVASGFVAGEALLGVLLALLTLLAERGWVAAPSVAELLFGRADLGIAGPWGGWLSLLIFGAVAWGLIRVPLRASRA